MTKVGSKEKKMSWQDFLKEQKKSPVPDNYVSSYFIAKEIGKSLRRTREMLAEARREGKIECMQYKNSWYYKHGPSIKK